LQRVQRSVESTLTKIRLLSLFGSREQIVIVSLSYHTSHHVKAGDLLWSKALLMHECVYVFGVRREQQTCRCTHKSFHECDGLVGSQQELCCSSVVWLAVSSDPLEDPLIRMTYLRVGAISFSPPSLPVVSELESTNSVPSWGCFNGIGCQTTSWYVAAVVCFGRGYTPNWQELYCVGNSPQISLVGSHTPFQQLWPSFPVYFYIFCVDEV
jgi:hypothetical protein